MVVEVSDSLLGILCDADAPRRAALVSGAQAGEEGTTPGLTTATTHPERLVLEEGKAGHDADVNQAADRTKVLLKVGARGVLRDATNVEATSRHCAPGKQWSSQQGRIVCIDWTVLETHWCLVGLEREGGARLS